MSITDEVNKKIDEIQPRMDETTRYAHVMRYLVGDKDIGVGLAILTSWNPEAIEKSREENKERQEDIKKELKRWSFHYTEQKGIYIGIEENSLVIYEITIDDAKSFGKDWDQETIIHVTKKPDSGLIFRLIYMDQVSKTRIVDDIAKDPIEMGVSSEEKEKRNIRRIQDMLDNFSEVGGRLAELRAKSKHNRQNTNIGTPRKYGLGFFGPKAREEE